MRIEVRQVSKDFLMRRRKLSVLDKLNLDIADGRFVCLLGPSGCGKSTLLRCIAGLEVPTTGAVQVGGKNVTGPGPDRAMVFQDYALFPWCTVAENILFGLRLRRNKHHNTRPEAEVLKELVALVGLMGFEGAYPHQISGGMRQRVGIARALSVNPGVLLMDEPFAAVDAITREGLQQQLLDVWIKTGKTILFVTHSVEEAAYLGDEVHVFSARPASIRESFVIGLPRPRDSAAPEFVAIASRMRKSINDGMRAPQS
jgi:NitT/TauT family transport system ATP-binding protein